jgi:hypothetical protein
VTVTSQKQVGPYETVQLHSNDGSALTSWLKTNGYVVPAADAPVIAAYAAQKFDFLALKLVPGEGVNAMQPVRVTSKGASISLPLHMVAVGTGATTGITIYVVADDLRFAARVGLGDELQQLRVAPAVGGGHVQRARMADRELALARSVHDRQHAPAERPVRHQRRRRLFPCRPSAPRRRRHDGRRRRERRLGRRKHRRGKRR